MDRRQILINEILGLKEPFLREVVDFVHYLRLKEKTEAFVMSESALEKDWLCPEEDKAWQDL
ncbi:MAG: DUF2281 domain-containing protein [Chlamydiae bacterium]|nr:DUF2281 domain-containing protein [Chlamydiota bacterium]MBI3277639.1 DUF2281 domain-containing protein [Chlamydiota bacterium]